MLYLVHPAKPADAWSRVTRDLPQPSLEDFRQFVDMLEPDASDYDRLLALRLTWAVSRSPRNYPRGQ